MRKLVKRTGISVIAVICSVAAAVLPRAVTVNGAKQQCIKVTEVNQGLPSLKEIYKDQFLIGNVYNPSSQDGDQKEVLLRHFNVVTPENLMKPDAMQFQEGKFTFDRADSMMEFCCKNDLQMAGHTFVWHQQTSGWMTEEVGREEAIEHMKTHIQTVAGRYRGKMLAWDVVNEAIRDGARLPEDGDWTQCLRETGWLKAIGSDYIKLAFTFAYEADPYAKLYYNDYGLDDSEKAKIAAAMFCDLKAQGVPIDGIGMQSHYSTSTTASDVERSIELLEQAGAELSITELDIGVDEINSTVGLTKEQEKKQAALYAQLFLVYIEHAEAIQRVTFWGLDDTNTWRRGQYPCLFHSDYSPKEAFYAVADPFAYLGIPQMTAVDKHALEQAIQAADEITDQDLYTKESFRFFQEAKEEAARIYGEIPEEAEKSEVSAYAVLIEETVEKLNTAREKLSRRVETIFEDMRQGDWFLPYAQYVYENGMMTGMNEIFFGPAVFLSRGQFATILHRMENSPKMEYEEVFLDVPEQEFYTEAVIWANKNGIVTGYQDTGTFGPADRITREQMVVMIYRYAKDKKYDVSMTSEMDGYADKDTVTPFAKEAIGWAVAQEVITGDQGKLNPQGDTSRAACAVMIMRFIEKYK